MSPIWCLVFWTAVLLPIVTSRQPFSTRRPHVSDRPLLPFFDAEKMCGPTDICSCDDSKNTGKMADCIENSCYCDDYCLENGDCCSDYNPKVFKDRLKRPWIDSVISCASNTRINQGKDLYVINKCPKHVNDLTIRNKCRWGDGFKIFGKDREIPVIGRKSKFLYKNIYCSLCNEEYDVRFMQAKAVCTPPTPFGNETIENAKVEMKTVQQSYLTNDTAISQCKVTEFILNNWNSTNCTPKQEVVKFGFIVKDTCPSQNGTDAELCGNYTSMVVDTEGTIYKNWHCAKCHNRPDNHLTCKLPTQTRLFAPTREISRTVPVPENPRIQQNGQVRYRPISLLFSVNGHSRSSSLVEVENNGEVVKSKTRKVRCPVGQLSLANSCYDINCGAGRIFRNGKCARKKKATRLKKFENTIGDFTPAPTNTTNISVIPIPTMPTGCGIINLNNDEYTMYENSTIFIHGTDVYLNETFYKNATIDGIQYLQACVPLQFFSDNITEEYNKTYPLFSVKFDETQALVSLIGQVISIVSLAILLIVYSVFGALRNVPGMCLMSLAVALFLAQLLFVTGIAQVEHWHLCYAIAVAIHYFFLASFFWMNVMAYDLCRVFACTKGNIEPSGVLTFVCYSIYGWMSPLLAIIAAIVVDIYGDNLHTGDFEIIPKYANGLCFITNRDSLLIFFVVPAGVLTVANFVLFFITVCGIHKAMKTARLFQQAKKKQCQLLLFIKLAAIMGLTWIFGFLQSMTETLWATYIFIILNSLQGLFICLAFVCTRKVARLLRAKCWKKTYPATTKTTSNNSQKLYYNNQSCTETQPYTDFTVMQLETSL